MYRPICVIHQRKNSQNVSSNNVLLKPYYFAAIAINAVLNRPTTQLHVHHREMQIIDNVNADSMRQSQPQSSRLHCLDAFHRYADGI